MDWTGKVGRIGSQLTITNSMDLKRDLSSCVWECSHEFRCSLRPDPPRVLGSCGWELPDMCAGN